MAMIMRTIGRSILQKSPPPFSSPRWLSALTEEAATAAAPTTTQPKKDRRVFYKVVRANPKTSSVSDILNKWVNEGNEVKRYDIINLSNHFRTRKNFKAALQLYDWMESSKREITNADHAVRISLLYNTEGIASAEKYFNGLEISEKTNKTYGSLLGCYCKERIFCEAIELFEEIKALKYASTLNYNSMLALYYAMEQPDKVVSSVQEMEENNIAPDLYTYNLLINSYAAMKNFDAIEGLLEKMKNDGVEFTSFTYGNLSTIYCNSGFHEKASHFLEMMEKIKTEPVDDVFESCRTRIKLYTEMKNLAGVNRAWEALKSAFRTPTNTSYLFMLLALSKIGNQENLEKLFEEWEKGCSTYDYRLPNVLLHYYLSRDMIEEATSIYESVAKRKAEPNLRTLDLFTALCIKTRQIDLALKYLKSGLDKAKSRNSKWFPTDDTVKLFLNHFEENNDEERAKEFIQSMKKANRLDSNSSLLKTEAPPVEES